MSGRVGRSVRSVQYRVGRSRSDRFKVGSGRSVRFKVGICSGRFACCRNAKVCLLLMLLTAHAAYCYCSPLLLFLRIRSECLWSRCLTSFDDDLQSQADQRPIKYKTPSLQSSDTPSRTHICKWVAEHRKSSNSKGCRHVGSYL